MKNLQNEELSSNSSSDSTPSNGLELSFEYLMSKNCLKWITIASEQAMLMSVCLQSMVDELLNQKVGSDTNNIQVRLSQILLQNQTFNEKHKFFQTSFGNNTSISYIKRDGSYNRISESSSTDTISSMVRIIYDTRAL